jgi:hypothetical protein
LAIPLCQFFRNSFPFSNFPSAKNPPSKSLPSSKSLTSSFSKSFLPSDKQGGGATVLREGCDAVIRGNYVPASLSVNNLGKAAELHLAILLFSAVGAVLHLSLQNLEHNCAYVLISFSYSALHTDLLEFSLLEEADMLAHYFCWTINYEITQIKYTHVHF